MAKMWTSLMGSSPAEELGFFKMKNLVFPNKISGSYMKSSSSWSLCVFSLLSSNYINSAYHLGSRQYLQHYGISTHNMPHMPFSKPNPHHSINSRSVLKHNFDPRRHKSSHSGISFLPVLSCLRNSGTLVFRPILLNQKKKALAQIRKSLCAKSLFVASYYRLNIEIVDQVADYESRDLVYLCYEA